MQMTEVAFGVVIGVVGSLIATAIIAAYLKGKQKNIRRKIEELDYEEKFIEKISKGNVELIRSGFRVFSLCLFMVFMSGAVVLATNLFPFPQPLKTLIYMFAIGAWGASAACCFSYFQSLRSLSDLKKTKENISTKRLKLSSRL
ncbi:hypothetical protein K5Q02_11340 [Pseudomonas sp. MM211]|uniref:hypothetical protein n=1 Tax=Pseudomonas sp. MM211 TaxID=2866808 RepID=UPI001CEDE03C|nr:hypothetical protein [Pseudomonas sp. MM211]UCJ18911.1 hypothetical protein K5Q02_11340 [Pseudomonas sp. MM211]